MDKPVVSVIIPTYKDWQRLSLCLDALAGQSYPREYLEIIVVNNAGDKAPEDLPFPLNCQVISESKPGSYAARNAGIRKSRGDILGFTDSDCIPDRDWIQHAVNYFQANKACSRVAGKVSLFYRSSRLSNAELYEKIYAFNQDINVNRDGIAVTANMFACRSVFDQVGLFNEGLMSGGDFEWSIRARDAGHHIVYAEDAWVGHPARFRVDALTKKAKRVGRGMDALEKPAKYPFLQFIYNLRPPLGSFKLIFSKGKDLNLRQKIVVMMIRYYLSVVRAYEKYLVRLEKSP